MRVEHLPRVLEIERVSFPTPWPQDAYLQEIRGNRLASYIVAKVEEEVVGYAGMWVILDEAHITTIAVDPRYRRQSIGERLLLALIEEAIRRGARWMTLEVRKSNTAAQALYRKYGFRDIGVRRGYYSDNREDAIVMWAGVLQEPHFQNHLNALRAKLEGSDPMDDG
ncbi:MAG: ribosomal protein S18-alanine N-acetyltransferase [Armatimonadota bacterium]|nr:ribosomal protein S18-alanine N-acetyltransferase [Armatimonadota bacterium]MDR5702161.1 ribosomal protein S18-alanine N-acetyltransferase [Armatimonadota bacterium]